MNRISKISKISKMENLSNVSNEAVQNIASVYSEISGTVAFNNAIITGTLNNNNNTQIGSTLDVSGNTQLGSNLDVSGNTQLNSTLNVSGVATFGSDLDVSGNIHLVGAKSRIYVGSGSTGIRQFTISLNTFQQGDMQIKDKQLNTYNIYDWILVGPNLSIYGAFIINIYPNTTDNTWHIGIQVPADPYWTSNSVTITAIPISYFDALTNTGTY